MIKIVNGVFTEGMGVVLVYCEEAKGRPAGKPAGRSSYFSNVRSWSKVDMTP
jgi:hypothetical protein